MIRRLILALLTACAAHPAFAQTGRTFTYDCLGEAKLTLADTGLVLRVKRDTTRVSLTPCITRTKRDSVLVVPVPTPTPNPTPPNSSGVLPMVTELPPILPLQNGWRIAYDVSSVTVATDPAGQPALRMRFPAGMVSGISPATVYREGFASVSVMRWESVLNYDTNYVKHPSSVDKSVFVGVDGRNKMFTMMYDPTRLIPAIGLQEIVRVGTNVTTAWNLTANVGATPVIPRGRRFTLTCEATGNSAGMADGKVECWVDGVKFLSYPNIQFSTGAAKFTNIAWVPIYGGNGPALAREQSVYLGGLKVWGR